MFFEIPLLTSTTKQQTVPKEPTLLCESRNALRLFIEDILVFIEDIPGNRYGANREVKPNVWLMRLDFCCFLSEERVMAMVKPVASYYNTT